VKETLDGAHTLTAEDRFEIQDLLFRFMRSFDEKSWDKMRACLSEAVDCDYSSFRGTPPSTLSRDTYVSQRREALSFLKTQHNLSNISITASGAGIEARCNYAILRFHQDFDGSPDEFFHSYGHYGFKIVRSGEAWSISSIKQVVLMNHGNPALHGGLKN
jgi:3-phenylpropionate/cinnamic acid dioxygenase small subunit